MDLRDPITFSRVYADHAPEVEQIATRVLGDRAQAQDVTHDVFLRLWVNPGAYDPARADVGAYVRLLARSRALDALRSRGASGRATDRVRALAEQQSSPVAQLPQPSCELHEDRRALVTALKALPDPQREAVVLSYWGDLADHQVAARTGAPVGTAKSRIRLGLNRLRSAYEAA